MTIYTVHLPTEARDPVRIAETLRVIPDRASYAAFAFGPLWLLWHRAYFAVAGWVVAILALVAAVRFLGLTAPGAGLIVAIVRDVVASAMA